MKKRKREISSRPRQVVADAPASGAGSRWVVVGVSLLLAAMTIGAYASLMQAGFILVDDDEYVERNPHILNGLNWPDIRWALTHQHSAMYHPLTTLSHMADVQFFGLSTEMGKRAFCEKQAGRFREETGPRFDWH